MSPPLFDHRLRAIRRDRAVRKGVETFLFDRAFDDCLDRLAEMRMRPGSGLLAGCPNPAWAGRLKESTDQIVVIDPGPLMANRAGGQCADIESMAFEPDRFDLCLCIGLLDSANDLLVAASSFHRVLRPSGLFLGAIAGGHSLPRLRRAMVAADRLTGQASPHVHPRIDAPNLARLLAEAGFAMPVVDVDRVNLTYRSLDALVADLRAMGSTNILAARSRRPLLRQAVATARKAFLDAGPKATEQVEILHFAGWKQG